MKKQGNYLMKSYFIKRNKAQASIEFSVAFVLALLLMILSCNLFVWLNHNIVQRQKEYELSRVRSANSPNSPLKGVPGKLDFYITNSKDPNCTNPNNCQPNTNYRPLNVFVAGGYNK